MSPNNSNSMSAWSRQMQRLRLQVDRIDRRLLHLLQQRTKLSGQIGEIKRAHGAVIYVPERERELLARLMSLREGLPSPRAVAAIYREILSSSRAAQGQPPLGLLKASAPFVLPVARLGFGACDRFQARATWKELARDLESGSLSLALLTGDDLARVLLTKRWRNDFLEQLEVTGDLVAAAESVPLERRIFCVTPRRNGAMAVAEQMLILIECKSTANAVKSLLNSMPDLSIHAEQLIRRGPPAGRSSAALVRLTSDKPASRTAWTDRWAAAEKSAGLAISILGTYPATENYGG